VSSEPDCPIWWHLVIVGGLALAALAVLAGRGEVIAGRVAAAEVQSARAEAVSAEILRRLERIERKLDEGKGR
jgi:hypothetical protein